MPYIPREDRKQYQDAIKEIAEKIPEDRMQRPGHINYIVSLLLDKVYGPEMRYSDHNEAIGVLSCIQAELYRRKTAPYEDLKIDSEGDLQDL
jgi:hypothetical protein